MSLAALEPVHFAGQNTPVVRRSANRTHPWDSEESGACYTCRRERIMKRYEARLARPRSFRPASSFGTRCFALSLRSRPRRNKFNSRQNEVMAEPQHTRARGRRAERSSSPTTSTTRSETLAIQSVENLRTDSETRRAPSSNAIISRTGMSISYDWLSNKTAQQVFYEGKGNCLAYTNLCSSVWHVRWVSTPSMSM